jgi:cobalt-precorrin-5B (C1)-methyltransferase
MFSNFLGETLDMMTTMDFQEVLLVGHIGKLVKVAGGIMNTHSRSADCRKEIITAHAAVAGADTETCRRLMSAATTDSCIEIMEAAGVKEQAMASIVESIQWQLEHRVRENFVIGAMTFSNVYGVLGTTGVAKDLMEKWRSEGAL